METSSTSHSVQLGTEARPSIPNGRSATRLPPTEVLGGVRRHGHTELHDSPPPCETAFSMWAEGVCEFQDFGISSRIFLTLEGIPRIPRIQVSSAILNPQLTRPTSSSRPLDAHRCPSGQRIRGLRGAVGRGAFVSCLTRMASSAITTWIRPCGPESKGAGGRIVRVSGGRLRGSSRFERLVGFTWKYEYGV